MTPREKAIMFIAIHTTVHINEPDKLELREGMKEFLRGLHGEDLDIEGVFQDMDVYDPELQKAVNNWAKWLKEDMKA